MTRALFLCYVGGSAPHTPRTAFIGGHPEAGERPNPTHEVEFLRVPHPAHRFSGMPPCDQELSEPDRTPSAASTTAAITPSPAKRTFQDESADSSGALLGTTPWR
jgi:hypothetical protein